MIHNRIYISLLFFTLCKNRFITYNLDYKKKIEKKVEEIQLFKKEKV